MSEHVAAATRFGQSQMVEYLPFDRFFRVGLTKVNGVGCLAHLRHFILKVTVLVGKYRSARETFDGDNHLICIIMRLFYFIFIYILWVHKIGNGSYVLLYERLRVGLLRVRFLFRAVLANLRTPLFNSALVGREPTLSFSSFSSTKSEVASALILGVRGNRLGSRIIFLSFAISSRWFALVNRRLLFNFALLEEVLPVTLLIVIQDIIFGQYAHSPKYFIVKHY